MPLPETLLAEIRAAQRPTEDWFSIKEIEQRDPDLKIAATYIQRGSGTKIEVARENKSVYERLESWAARLLEHEIRDYDQRIWSICNENSFVPTPADDSVLVDELRRYLNTSLANLRTAISDFAQYKPLSPSGKPDDSYARFSKLEGAAKRLTNELRVSVPLTGEIARLELADSGYEAIDRIGYAQTRLERFLNSNYSIIPHPFNDTSKLTLSAERLANAVKLVTFVVYQRTDEHRLSGFEKRFVSAFLRYLTCARDSAHSVVEQVTALVEPFLKKLCLLFDLRNREDKPLWHSGLDAIIAELSLSSSNLREADASYWQSRPLEDAVLRLAYQLRHKGAHEAHDYKYYELERHAYFAFAALIISCDMLLRLKSGITKAIEQQGDVDAVRDLFVKIDELPIGPEGPRSSPRLEKLLSLCRRAENVWPNCSSTLRNLLESEYLAVREELIEADREADIEAYLDSMRPDDSYY